METDVGKTGVTKEQMGDFLRCKAKAQKVRNQELWQQAVQEADVIVRMIIDKFAPMAIYQWGSVLDEKQFSEISDIDIAVEGLGSAEQYFAMQGEADKLTRFPLDLVELEHVEPEYAELIQRHGRCVYKAVERNE